MNLELTSDEVTAYLKQHLHEPAASFILKSHPFSEISAKELTQQLVGLQKARTKFPGLFEQHHILYPPKTNLEQTSSETTAQYKATLVKPGKMIDLTGGLGIDVSAFAKAGFQTTHVELNESLQKYAAHNLAAQGLNTKSAHRNGVSYLQQENQNFDLIYLDPSRKTAASSKAVLLEDYEPNVLQHLDFFFSVAPILMLKTSPMLDIAAGLKQLPKTAEVHVVAVKNEVKELLWILKNKPVKEVKVTCVNLETSQPVLSGNWSRKNQFQEYIGLQKYLYEPNAAVMKSQLFDLLSDQYSVKKIDQDAHLFTSDICLDFPGRVFEVVEVIDAKPKLIKRKFGNSPKGVVTRNFKMTVSQLREKYRFKEHETDYLFFTSVAGSGPQVIHCKKIA